LKYLTVFLLFISLTATANEGPLYGPDSTVIYYVRNNELYTADGKQLLYFQKGNIIFTGETDTKDNIFMLTTSVKLGSEGVINIFMQGETTPKYKLQSGKFHIGNSEMENDNDVLVAIYGNKGTIEFRNGQDDSLLAMYPNASIDGAMATLIAHQLIAKNKIEAQFFNKIKSLPMQSDRGLPEGIAVIKPLWNNVTANEWVWDGRILRPRWNNNPQLEWTFDGETIKPAWGNNNYLQYSWDGELFKPIWRTSRTEEWTFDGSLLKPAWSSEWDKQLTIQSDGVIKPFVNTNPDLEWKVEGNMPIPCIILIVSHIARPF
jgi:hypothetical protein